MGVLDKEIAAYTKVRDHLEANHIDEWAVVYGNELIGTYDTLEDAAHEAIARFGRGPYLIRQVGAPPKTLHIPFVSIPRYADR